MTRSDRNAHITGAAQAVSSVGLSLALLSACTLNSHPAEQVNIQSESQMSTRDGVLTRRGPDAFSWWAVTTDDGTVWRLAPAPALPTDAFTALQREMVRVRGTPDGHMLSNPVFRVIAVERLGSP